jgi:hypothetical protein
MREKKKEPTGSENIKTDFTEEIELSLAGKITKLMFLAEEIKQYIQRCRGRKTAWSVQATCNQFV